MTDTYWPLLPAAGVGRRMGSDRPKQYLELNGRMLMDHTLEAMLSYPAFSELVLVLSDGDPYWPSSQHYNDARILVAPGGQERCDSVLNGLKALEGKAADNDWVVVHDIARPCLRHSDIDQLLAGLGENGALLASPTRDTMKRGVQSADGQVHIDHTVEREQLWHALTPQVFRYAELKMALQKALEQGFAVTDEASAIEFSGGSPRLIEGRSDNIKVTRPEDLLLASLFLNNP